MRRTTPQLPVTPAMLRHFAILTGVATLCLAMFATGENADGAAGKAQVASGEGGMMSAMLGAEERALKGNQAQKPAKVVNGLTIGAGRRPVNDGGSGDEGEPDRQEAGGQGDIRNFYPQQGQPSSGVVASVEPGLQTAAMVKDAAGVPAPAANAASRPRAGLGRTQAPRQATPQDYDRMMAESQRRAGPNSVDE